MSILEGSKIDSAGCVVLRPCKHASQTLSAHNSRSEGDLLRATEDELMVYSEQ